MFTTLVIAPLYNFLIFTVDSVYGNYLWISVAITTIIFKTILIPLYKKQIKDQIILNHLQPRLKDLQEKYKDKKEELGRETLEIYKKYNVNPFVSILILFVQLPFLIGLYRIFLVDLTSRKDVLYSFVKYPDFINSLFLGVNLSEKNLIFAVIAGISQYILGAYMFSNKKSENASTTDDFANAMNTQMKYFLPVLIVVVSAMTPSVISLYIIVGNIFGIVQEILIKKPLEKKIKEELAK